MDLKINNVFKNTPGRLFSILQKRAGLILLILFLASALAGGAAFYFYAIKTPDVTGEEQLLNINKQLYQDIINRLNARETNIQQGIGQDYRDVFR